MMLRQGVLEDRAHDWIHRKTADADIYFTANQGEEPLTVTLAAWDPACAPELWDPYTGKISDVPEITETDSIRITLVPGKSMFVVLNHGKSNYKKAPIYMAKSLVAKPLGDVWSVGFNPKMDEPFAIESFKLKDFSQCDDERLMYFAGTATYNTTIQISKEDLSSDKRVVLNLGELNDLAEILVNGKKVGTLWYPPFEVDITDFLNVGENELSVAVTNNWANRLIGDERHEPDFEWGTDRGESRGRAMKAFPSWFMKDQPRPSKDRKAFVIWSYFREDSQLQPAGLVGPVELEIQSI